MERLRRLLRIISTVVGAKLCFRRALEARGKGIIGVREVVYKEAQTLKTINVISQLQYFVARCLSSYVGNVFGLRSIRFCFLPPAS
jgi:hypothetical protein